MSEIRRRGKSTILGEWGAPGLYQYLHIGCASVSKFYHCLFVNILYKPVLPSRSENDIVQGYLSRYSSYTLFAIIFLSFSFSSLIFLRLL
jgi:hypothetical protein